MGGPFEERPYAGHAIAGVAAVTAAAVIANPFDSLKSLAQVGTAPKQQVSALQAFQGLRRGSFRGIGWSVLANMTGLGACFGVYTIMSAYFNDGREDNFFNYTEEMAAGINGGAIGAIVSAPFEFMKTRYQVSSPLKNVGLVSLNQQANCLASKLLPGYSLDAKVWDNTFRLLSPLSLRPTELNSLKQYPWLLMGSARTPSVSEVQGLSRIISLEGWSALWRGLRAGITRDSIFGGLFFSSWQFINVTMLSWKSRNMNPPPRTLDDLGPVSPLLSTLGATISGIIAGAASHPFDTGKARTDCTVIPKYIMMERKIMRWEEPGSLLEKLTGTSFADRSILLRGIWLRMARCGIASFVLVGGYYAAIDYLL